MWHPALTAFGVLHFASFINLFTSNALRVAKTVLMRHTVGLRNKPECPLSLNCSRCFYTTAAVKRILI